MTISSDDRGDSTRLMRWTALVRGRWDVTTIYDPIMRKVTTTIHLRNERPTPTTARANHSQIVQRLKGGD